MPPRGHTVPQLPQLLMSLDTSAQTPFAPPQTIWPTGQTQVAPWQFAPGGQAVPQPPQFVGSEVKSVQTPLQRSGVPPPQAAHWPLTQLPAQVLPHWPQLF